MKYAALHKGDKGATPSTHNEVYSTAHTCDSKAEMLPT